jgi:hypothetical protein
VAAEKSQLEILQTPWEWAKNVLTQEELNNIFLAKMEKKELPVTWQQRRAK